MGKSKFPGLGTSSANDGSRASLRHRSRYIDHSLSFVNWVNGLGFEKTRFGRAVQILEQRFRLRRAAAIFLFSLVLASLLYYDFDFSFSARIGDRVVRDIKSPLSLEMIDEVTTEEKRRLVENAVPLIFDYDRTTFEDLYGRVYTSFRQMRQTMHEQLHQAALSRDEFERFNQVNVMFSYKAEFERTLGRRVSDEIFEWLVVKGFSPRVESLAMQSLDHWSSYRIAEGVEKLNSDGRRDILIREVTRAGHGREVSASLDELRDVMRADEFPMPRVQFAGSSQTTDQRLFGNFMRSLVAANVTLNRQETETRKQRAREQVLPVVMVIKKNQVIVPEGSVVQPLQAAILAEIENQRSGRNRNVVVLMASILFVVISLVFSSYLRRFTLNKVRVSNKDVTIMGLVTILVVIITKFFLFLTNSAFSTAFGSMIPETAFLFAAPVASGTMLVGLLINAGEVVWIFSLFLAVVLSLMVDIKFSFLIVTVVGSIAAARGVFGCKTRNDIYRAGLRTGLVNAGTVFLVLTVQHLGDESFMHQIFWDIGAGFVSGLLSSFVAMTLIPLLESVFNCTTDVKLLELSNLNHPLLKEMIVRAPGTYHHSLVVGSMVEAAAEEIGANPLLAKVMSYYHDIGKTQHATYFIENQKPGANPHDQLSPHMSKTILIAHVKDGVELGLKYKLGKPIIDGIVQHHGTTLIAFFYNRAKERSDADNDDIRDNDFRYPGPKPQFREAALIMIADSIEAASRSLDEPTPSRLQNIVRNIIQRKFMDGQLDECNLTLRDLSVIEDSFTRILFGIYHQRIDYPRSFGGGAAEEARSVTAMSSNDAGSTSPQAGAMPNGSSNHSSGKVIAGPGAFLGASSKDPSAKK